MNQCCDRMPTTKESALIESLWSYAGRLRAEYLVLCPDKHCPLAAIFELPSRGRVLCTPAYKTLRRSIFIDPKRPDDEVHFHAALTPMDHFAEDDDEYGRCRCGLWWYTPAKITSRPFGETQDGQPYTLASYVSTADSEHSREVRARGGKM